MADVMRGAYRQALTAATSISLAVDSRASYKVLRFRCDTEAKPFRRDGILGVFHCGYDTLEDADEDHGVRMLRNLRACIAKFWTPLGGHADSAAEADMLRKVKCIASDGGASERKLMFMTFRSICPGVAIILRDFAHAARIALQKPQQFDPEFNAVHTHLFNNGANAKQHAVIPDIQYSSKLKDLLVAAQRTYLRIPAESNPLRVVLKHLSYAKHRFDSMADPVAKTALMLMPLCTLLSTTSCDARVHPNKRQRAVEALQLFTPKFCLTLGALADYGLVTAAFLRKYDTLDHDIAKSERELITFEEQMCKIFKDGWLLATHAQTAAGPRELRGEFIVEWVRRQTKRACVFNAGPRQLLVWGPCPAADVTDLAARLGYMTDIMLKRLRAESDSDHLRSAFQCFDLKRVVAGRLDRRHDPALGGSARRACISGIRKLASALRMDVGRCELEYLDVAAELCASLPACATAAPDNRLEWSRTLEPHWLDMKFPNRIAEIEVLPHIVRFYNSILDGECQVERDLGAVLAEISTHCNLNVDGVDDILILKSSELKGARDFGNEADGSITDATKSFLRLWKQVYGARFAYYDNKGPGRQQKSERRAQVGTFASVKRKVFAAAHARTLLSEQSIPLSRHVSGAPLQPAAVGDLRASRFCTPGHAKFMKLTAQKSEKARVAMGCRRRGVDPHPRPKLTHSGPAMPDLSHIKKVAFVIPAADRAAAGAGLTARAGMTAVETGWRRCHDADIVIAKSLAPLLVPDNYADPANPMSVADALLIVGLGRIVVSPTSWALAKCDPSRLTVSDVVAHKAMTAQTTNLVFSRTLRDLLPDAYRAAKLCCRSDDSKWKVRHASSVAECSAGEEWLQNEADIWKLASKTRRVITFKGVKVARLASGLDTVRSAGQA